MFYRAIRQRRWPPGWWQLYMWPSGTDERCSSLTERIMLSRKPWLATEQHTTDIHGEKTSSYQYQIRMLPWAPQFHFRHWNGLKGTRSIHTLPRQTAQWPWRDRRATINPKNVRVPMPQRLERLPYTIGVERRSGEVWCGRPQIESPLQTTYITEPRCQRCSTKSDYIGSRVIHCGWQTSWAYRLCCRFEDFRRIVGYHVPSNSTRKRRNTLILTHGSIRTVHATRHLSLFSTNHDPDSDRWMRVRGVKGPLASPLQNHHVRASDNVFPGTFGSLRVRV